MITTGESHHLIYVIYDITRPSSHLPPSPFPLSTPLVQTYLNISILLLLVTFRLAQHFEKSGLIQTELELQPLIFSFPQEGGSMVK